MPEVKFGIIREPSNVPFDGLIGSDYLDFEDFGISGKKLELGIRSIPFPLKLHRYSNSQPESSCFLLNARSETVVKVKINNPSIKEGISPELELTEGVYLAKGLLTVNDDDLTQLKFEIEVLEEVSRQIFLEVHENRNMLERIEWSKTWKGIYFNFLGYIFSGYCLWKILICTINIVFDRVGKKDPVTRGIEIAIHWMGFNFDVNFWSQQVSFYLVGAIVFTSIRGLLLTLTKFFNRMSSSKSSNIIVLVMAQIMGMYFVSSVLLLRMNMPVQYRTIITEVLGALQFSFYHRWFDVIFLVSALGSILTLYLAHKPPTRDTM
ncbi:unnamed protein product [Brassicogethes aeneus]|uniref:Abscisic acid G-protein coupled receptor-like domain-containing protein n=1 Tax=Brassicogethes aeneus TaxID=1431903 RepID=A0A9P0FBS2_BRAAE|nr:unnamed protein product [Brassicogethes aeneus]